MPSEQELSAFYAEEPLDAVWETQVEKSITPAAFHRFRLKRIEAFVPRGRLLDVGAGFGHFVREARSCGWQEVRGLDISEEVGKYVQQRHGFVIDVGRLRHRYEGSYFDCIHMKDVIEHLADPLAELRECCRILRPNGLLIVETLNTDSVYAKMAGKRYRGFIKGHVSLFGPRALSRAMRMAGLQVVESHAGDEIPVRMYLSWLPPRRALSRTLKKARLRNWYAASMVLYARKRVST